MTTFDERVLYDNRLYDSDENGQCVNCHVPQDYNRRGRSQFHVRQQLGCTVLIQGNQVTKVDLKTDSTLSAGVYPAWHPQKDLVAYSVNKTYQAFHTKDVQKIEVLDFASDLILYDVATNRVFDIDHQTDEFESFPAWSPDGKTLYYVSAHVEMDADSLVDKLVDGYDQLHCGRQMGGGSSFPRAVTMAITPVCMFHIMTQRGKHIRLSSFHNAKAMLICGNSSVKTCRNGWSTPSNLRS